MRKFIKYPKTSITAAFEAISANSICITQDYCNLLRETLHDVGLDYADCRQIADDLYENHADDCLTVDGITDAIDQYMTDIRNSDMFHNHLPEISKAVERAAAEIDYVNTMWR